MAEHDRTELRGEPSGSSPAPLPLLYLVGPQPNNEELRYSLRSVARNLPHSEVWIVGDKPKWVRGVRFIQTVQKSTKWQNSTANLLTACIADEVPERFVYMNDDFHVMRPIPEVPILHRGPVADVLAYYRGAHGSYSTGMKQTRELLRELGHSDPISYELHAPLPIVKRDMLDTLRLAAETAPQITALHKRTLYGNLHALGGEQIVDVKCRSYNETLPTGAFLSTSPSSFAGRAGGKLRAVFPDPSPYEVS